MNISFMRSVVLGCLIGLLFSAVVFADYHYASHTGSDEYPYSSWDTAADSIQPAVDATSPGDTLFIASGFWQESVVLGFYDSLAIIGAGWDSTFLYTDEYQTAALLLGDGCYVDGINLRSNWIAGDSYAGASLIISSCKFVGSLVGAQVHRGTSAVLNCIFDSCSIGISSPGWSVNLHIKNNLITNTTGYTAIQLQANTVLVENNIIINCVGSGNSSIEGAPYHAVVRNNVFIRGLGGIFGNRVLNNIVEGMRLPGPEGGHGIIATAFDTVANNILTGCRVGIDVFEDSLGCLINYNCFWRNDTDIRSYGFPFDSIGNIFRDPMFVNPESLNFHLQAFSPCIDAGEPNILDMDGTRSDIGIYGGPVGESYFYLDLPPGTPDSLSGFLSPDDTTVYLSWRQNWETDFLGYRLYRGTTSGFEPSPENMIAEPQTCSFEDGNIVSGRNYFYRVSAVDSQGNESAPSFELSIIQTGVDDARPGRPEKFNVLTNYPNPFNSGTVISFYVADIGPIPAEIKIEIYDIAGRVVRTLVNSKYPIGTHNAVWDGRDDSESDLPSGVYFARIYQWGLNILGNSKKMVLVK